MYGICECGCGGKTTPARQSVTKHGYIKGVCVHFVLGHGTVSPRPPSRIIVVEGVECRTLPLTKGLEAILDVADYERFSRYRYFAHKRRGKWYAYRSPARVKGVRRVTNIALHQEILPVPEGLEVDHINGNSLDFRQCNLRPATRKQNCQNMSLPSTNTTGYKGVAQDRRRRRLQVGIKTNGRRIALGSFPLDQAEAAARCYDRAALSLFGEFAKLNFPREDYQCPSS